MSTEIIPCLLLPLLEKNIFLPSSAVAEIIPYEKPKTTPDIPKWLVGILTWRGINIPLTYLEKMESHLAWNGVAENLPDETTHKYHVAILNRIYKAPEDVETGKSNKYPFFSVVLKSVPKLFRISSDGVKLVSPCSEAENRYIMEIKVQNDYAYIPNLASLWKMIDALPSRLQWFRQIIL